MQEMVSTPGPKYSTMAPVPPFTVRMPATLQMMSLGEFHFANLPVSFTPITCDQGARLTCSTQPHSLAAVPACPVLHTLPNASATHTGQMTILPSFGLHTAKWAGIAYPHSTQAAANGAAKAGVQASGQRGKMTVREGCLPWGP